MSELPTYYLLFNEQGWAYTNDADGNVLWIASDHEVARYGGAWVGASDWPQPVPESTLPPPASTWEWPHPSPYLGDGTYSGEYPTHYDWRADVEEVARYLVDTYDVWCNTYANHPPGWWLDSVSLDVWARGGRGHAIDPDLGQQVFNDIYNNGKPPWIWWTIWWGWMWSIGGGWEGAPWGPANSDPNHYSHIHFTFY